MSGATELTIVVGPELFRFTSAQHWMNKARSWFAQARRDHDIPREAYICIDSAGRVCAWGAHFRRAEEEGTYPVVVYAIEELP